MIAISFKNGLPSIYMLKGQPINKGLSTTNTLKNQTRQHKGSKGKRKQGKAKQHNSMECNEI